MKAEMIRALFLKLRVKRFRASNFSRPRALLVALFLLTLLASAKGESLPEHLKEFTSVLSRRNLDSLRQLIDPTKVYVEMAPKPGSYLSQSQTLAVVESFFQSHTPLSFSYVLVREAGKSGIAIGTLSVLEAGHKISHKINFGFEKNSRNQWLLARIIIH